MFYYHFSSYCKQHSLYYVALFYKVDYPVFIQRIAITRL
nr:MAG TPA: hypothetical protein [Bacteriophage sp.]DAS06008.1 MAG TPA: hypothetical protein [Caudoviricetes sp.]